jgi:hypothetical protein
MRRLTVLLDVISAAPAQQSPVFRNEAHDVATRFFKTSDAGAELTVESRLNQGALTIVTGVVGQAGHCVKGALRMVDLSLRQATLDRLLPSGMAMQKTFELAPGCYVVRVVVRDSQSETMAERIGTVQ